MPDSLTIREERTLTACENGSTSPIILNAPPITVP